MKTNSTSDSLTIGAVARRTGLRTSAIRYYEEIGILPAPLRHNGQRRYTSRVFQQIGFIQTARSAGFSIEEMKTLLPSDLPAPPYAEQVQILARRKMDELSAVIAHAQAVQEMLKPALVCHCEQAEECPLFTAMPGSEEKEGKPLA